ncbi:Sodium, potassium, lithium and rubidium/H(+) antiporter [Arthrobacter ulcerisalmonis]|uniref:Sodium, potassium, lithium and rubidium/H(+) antiporter n=1 Tax=Arthrobacter ulcerisalmonis TaxID=2483813 RepID=A0A3P5WV46_9MICC|nr:Na+/H+ antiporter [Arthrobacter ulcerisalmonis]VDC23031.1 Sodium, potassium, lithium and rubidium/H(+) antiporter [Arthrobacter ulcerisalmonis]
MDQLALIVGLLLATVMAVGLGDRLRLPYPVLMLLLAVALTFIPGFPDLDIAPELILPIFLPPLLFATAQRSSWAVFRVRWRTLLMLAVALVVITTAVVAGAAWLMIPGIGIPAAIALGAMVAPPDPVAVESVAGRVHMPRRLITVLQSEGLFNDAAAIVIFQAAVAAAVGGTRIASDVVLQFVIGAALAVVVGIVMGWLIALVTRLVTSMVARSAVTLVVPFAAYILAEEVHASGVIAVVVTALEMQRHSRPQDAAERVTRTAFWDVVELLVTGLAFGLVGLEIRHVIQDEGTDIFGMLGVAAVVCVLVFAARFAWLGVLALGARKRQNLLQPTTAKEVLILTWCGMRGLATLALALALPVTLADGTPFPGRDYLLVIACAVLLATLVLPGLTLPWLMRVLDASHDGSEERDAARLLALRAQGAAVAALKQHDLMRDLPPEKVALVKEKMKRLHAELVDGGLPDEPLAAKRQRGRELSIAVQTIALDAARQEVVAARSEPDTDPEVADRVLRQLDLRTMIMPE